MDCEYHSVCHFRLSIFAQQGEMDHKHHSLDPFRDTQAVKHHETTYHIILGSVYSLNRLRWIMSTTHYVTVG